jgi:poly(hydroxyalkanoate) granule-associated protein
MTTKKKATIQDEVLESAQRIWRAGLGAFAMAEEEGTKFFNSLVEKGEDFEKRGKKQFDKVQGSVEEQIEDVRDRAESAFGKLGKSFDAKVSDALQRLGVPSRMEIQKLTKRVETLTKKVDELNKPKTRKKTASRSRKTA